MCPCLCPTIPPLPCCLLSCREPDPGSQEASWWCCSSCSRAEGRRKQQEDKWQAPVVPPDAQDPAAEITEWQSMLGLLLSLPPGGCLQLAVLRAGVRYTQRIQGYLHALSAADKDQPPLLQGPLVCWDEAALADASVDELEVAFNSLVDYLRSRNPLVQQYLTMAERDWPKTPADNQPDMQPPPVSTGVRNNAQGAVAACMLCSKGVEKAAR